jgi:multidrug transporter EmrE-like cation transporter
MAYFLLFVTILSGVAGQLLLKYGMSRRPGFSLGDFSKLVRDFYIVGGFACYGGSTLLYLQALAKLDLSVAYPMVSLGYVLVILMSKIVFKEPISLARWLAAGIISLGVILVGLGSA